MTPQINDLNSLLKKWKRRHTLAAGITLFLIVFAFVGMCPVMLYINVHWLIYLAIAVFILLLSMTFVGICIHKIGVYEDLLEIELLNMNRGRYFDINLIKEKPF